MQLPESDPTCTCPVCVAINDKIESFDLSPEARAAMHGLQDGISYSLRDTRIIQALQQTLHLDKIELNRFFAQACELAMIEFRESANFFALHATGSIDNTL